MSHICSGCCTFNGYCPVVADKLFYVAPSVCRGSVFGLCLFSSVCSSIFSFILIGKREWIGCFTLKVLPMSCFCSCSADVPYGGVSWYAVCDCGIF